MACHHYHNCHGFNCHHHKHHHHHHFRHHHNNEDHHQRVHLEKRGGDSAISKSLQDQGKKCFTNLQIHTETEANTSTSQIYKYTQKQTQIPVLHKYTNTHRKIDANTLKYVLCII